MRPATRFLVEVARRLGLGLRDTDMLSRISGDEFLLLLNPVRSEAEVAEYIEFLLHRLKAPFFIDGSELFASASIGVSIYPDHGRDYEVLRQNADIAMYRIKNETKGAALIFDAGMQREALAPDGSRAVAAARRFSTNVSAVPSSPRSTSEPSRSRASRRWFGCAMMKVSFRRRERSSISRSSSG